MAQGVKQVVHLSKGKGFSSSSLHVSVYCGKMLNPKLFFMAPQSVCMCVCESLLLLVSMRHLA